LDQEVILYRYSSVVLLVVFVAVTLFKKSLKLRSFQIESGWNLAQSFVK